MAAFHAACQIRAGMVPTEGTSTVMSKRRAVAPQGQFRVQGQQKPAVVGDVSVDGGLVDEPLEAEGVVGETEFVGVTGPRLWFPVQQDVDPGGIGGGSAAPEVAGELEMVVGAAHCESSGADFGDTTTLRSPIRARCPRRKGQ
ncbi:hypothetical protein AB0L74_33945 [Streptomyces sp. NPDC052020]|uniref:hypothetical protein n=1 Tax=Streptomyces sp. NPDC052020 TaxID=3155677 RepID=UPI00342B043E